jgi:hypothetical protein
MGENRVRQQGKVRLDRRHLALKGMLRRHDRVIFLGLAGWLDRVLGHRRRRPSGWLAGEGGGPVTATRRQDGRPTGVESQ